MAQIDVDPLWTRPEIWKVRISLSIWPCVEKEIIDVNHFGVCYVFPDLLFFLMQMYVYTYQNQ